MHVWKTHLPANLLSNILILLLFSITLLNARQSLAAMRSLVVHCSIHNARSFLVHCSIHHASIKHGPHTYTKMFPRAGGLSEFVNCVYCFISNERRFPDRPGDIIKSTEPRLINQAFIFRLFATQLHVPSGIRASALPVQER